MTSTEQVDIRSLSVAEAAKLLKVQPKVVRAHIRRGLPMVDAKIDLIVYGAWLNRQERHGVALAADAALLI